MSAPINANLEALKDEVTKLLMTKHDFSIEDAETKVQGSLYDSANMWNDNADANQLADFLASDDDDD